MKKDMSKDMYQGTVGSSTSFNHFSSHSAPGLPCSSLPKHFVITALEGEQGAPVEGSPSRTHTPSIHPGQGWQSCEHPQPLARSSFHCTHRQSAPAFSPLAFTWPTLIYSLITSQWEMAFLSIENTTDISQGQHWWGQKEGSRNLCFE